MNPGVKRTIIATLSLMALFIGMFVFNLTRERTLSPEQLVELGAFMFDEARPISYVPLTNQDSEPFAQGDFEGQWTFLFFGFTHCLDACPTAMAHLRQVRKLLEDNGAPADDSQFVMVSVDPARDTPEQLNQYVKAFHPEFIGLTGERGDIEQFAKQLNAVFILAEQNTEENYQVDHSAHISLINPQGEFQGFFRAPLNPGNMVKVFQTLGG